MKPYKCPICSGTGKVPHLFYSTNTSSSNGEPIMCKTCSGTGIVWGRDFEYPNYPTYPIYPTYPTYPTYPYPWYPWEGTWCQTTSDGAVTVDVEIK